MGQITGLAEARKQQLFFYSPYSFVRKPDPEKQLENCVYSTIRDFEKKEHNRIIPVDVNGQTHLFFVSFLPWDTGYFGITSYKLFYVLYTESNLETLEKAVAGFKQVLFSEKAYCFTEIPSEDTMLLQAMSANGFRLVETRLTYWRNNLQQFDHERHAVRKAEEKDIPNLMRVAREMRNVYDRFHAETIFGNDKADEFLATYIEQSVRGFADVVLVPAEQGVPSDSFLTAKYFRDEWAANGVNISKMVLSAVSSATNKGWYKKLIAEMTYHLRDEGAEIVFMNTQSTNRAVIHTWESLGYRLGRVTHVLSCHNL